ncbi:MAG: LysM peptidoglycan-binding domain-containing protein [Deltaproteobacteria bacterium]|nr:LysM peptidoglycan-binding domain-containing protein [Deltaproteobacteria bacterium]
MTQTIFRWLSLLILLTFMATALPAFAGDGQIYTIKKGDTLWDISQRFINDPYYWPNVWAENPDITNPHLIFPGQKIRILDGRLEIIPAYPGVKKNRPVKTGQTTTPAAPTPKTEKAVTIRSTGSDAGFILTSEKPLGTLVDSVDNRVLLTQNDLVFLKMKDLNRVAVGDSYGLFSRGKQIRHPQTDKPIGIMMYNLGKLQVTKIQGGTVIAKIGQVFREITRGAEVFAYTPQRKELTLKRAKVAEHGYIIAARDEKDGQGAGDIIFIDHGRDDGLVSGNLLYISRPRKVSDEILKQAGAIELPDEVLGAAVIIEPRGRTSSALIIKSADTMYIGDNITTATD